MIVGLLIAIYLAIVVNAIRIIQTEKKNDEMFTPWIS